MKKRLIKVIFYPLVIIYVPYFIGEVEAFINPSRYSYTPVIGTWFIGFLVLATMAIIFGMVHLVYKYVRYGCEL